MANNMPKSIPDLIAWADVHSALWQDNQASIGLSLGQVNAFKTLVESLTEANAAANIARQASKDATITLGESVEALRALGGAFVSVIKAYAESTENPAVYSLAGISPNNPPSTPPIPVAPSTFSASVNSDGSLTIRWKVAQPAGVTGVQYLILRRLIGEATYSMISSEGANKSFTDTTLPLGVDKVDYIVQPKRSTVLGPQSNVFSVQFGSVGTGTGLKITKTTSTPHAEPVKYAA